MNDRAIRGITSNKQIRFFAVNSTNTCKKASESHFLSVTSTIFLGRMISAAIMMGMDLKDYNSSLTVKIKSEGPLGGATVVSRNNGEIKGYVDNPEFEQSAESSLYGLKIGSAVGSGLLTIIKDLNLEQPFSGQIELQTGEIGDDLAYYYMKSEQIPSAVGLGILVNPDASIRTSGGFIVQLLPFASEETITQLEENINKMPNVSDLMDMGKTIEQILSDFILKGFEFKITDELEPSFKCDCSKDKFRNGVKLLGIEDLQDAIDKEGYLQAHCHFCNSKYTYNREELEDMIQELNKEK